MFFIRLREKHSHFGRYIKQTRKVHFICKINLNKTVSNSVNYLYSVEANYVQKLK